MCETYSCSYKTRKWPLCLYLWHYKCCYNKCLSYTLRKLGKTRTKNIEKVNICGKPGVSPWAEKRMNKFKMPKAIKCAIADLLGINTEEIAFHRPIDSLPS